nr:hypothetical protein [Tanacetum cinerariifolium]
MSCFSRCSWCGGPFNDGNCRHCINVSFREEPVYDSNSNSYNQTLDFSNPPPHHNYEIDSRSDTRATFQAEFAKFQQKFEQFCAQLSCSNCGGLFNDGNCPSCSIVGARSKFVHDPNPFPYDNTPDFYDQPPQYHVETNLCELCENDSHYGYDCPPRFSLVYGQEPCYNQNFVSIRSITSSRMSIQDMEDLKQRRECEIKIDELKLPVFYDDDDDEERSDSLKDNIISGLPPCTAITPTEPVLSTEEPDNSLSMGGEHLDTIPAMKSDEVIKSSVEDLIPIPSESEGIPDHMCDLPFHDNSPPPDVSKDRFEDFSEYNDEFSSTDDDSFFIDKIDYVEASPSDSELVSSETNNFDNSLPEFTTFANVFFDAEYESGSSDDQSCSDEDILEKIVSKPLFEEEITPMKIDSHLDNAESDLMESLRTHDSSLLISSKIDSLLDEFAGELTLLKSIPPGIDETDCDFEGDICLIEKLLYDNSSPRLPKEFVSANSDAEINFFSPSPILVKDSDSLMEKIDLFCTLDYPMPPGIEDDDYDSERDILILKDLPSNNCWE